VTLGSRIKFPNSLIILDLRRILMGSIKVGEAASFVYNGGSHPGKTRYVTAEYSDDERVRGKDLLTGEPRDFLYSRIDGVITVFKSANEKIHFIEGILPNHKSFGEQKVLEVFSVLFPEYKNTRYHHPGFIITPRNDIPSLEIQGEFVILTDKDGNKLSLMAGKLDNVICEEIWSFASGLLYSEKD
jgi:hypothetical protein